GGITGHQNVTGNLHEPQLPGAHLLNAESGNSEGCLWVHTQAASDARRSSIQSCGSKPETSLPKKLSQFPSFFRAAANCTSRDCIRSFWTNSVLVQLCSKSQFSTYHFWVASDCASRPSI